MKKRSIWTLCSLFLGALLFICASIFNAEPPSITRIYPDTEEYIIEKGTTVNFSFEANDEDGDLLAVEWYLGPNPQKRDEWTDRPKHSIYSSWFYTFDSIDTFYVYAYVYDDEGNNPIIWWEITVNNYPPSALRKSPSKSSITIQVGTKQTFTVSAYDQDENLKAVKWQKKIGDGNWQDTGEWNTISGSSASASHEETFNNEGTYYIKALVYDQEDEYDYTIWTVNVTMLNRDINIAWKETDIVEHFRVRIYR
jgi:hypothetical protein